MVEKRNHTSLNTRLVAIALAAFVPMLLVLLYALISLSDATKSYSEITRSVTYANETMDFKERMDYSMYLAVVRKREFKDLGGGEYTVNGIVTVNPYESIEEMKQRCSTLSDRATVDINRNQITRLHSTLESLERNVETLESMIQGDGDYEENMVYLDENIYMLTTVIQDGIQDYIRVETTNLQGVSLTQERHNASVYGWCIAISVTAVIAAAMLTVKALRSVTGPIQRLCGLTHRVAEGDFTAKSKPGSIYEIAVLAENFNEMTVEIGTLVANIKEKEKNLYLMETKLLQAQINPHFLYNTLDAIVWLAEDKRNQEAIAMVTSLSEFFRTTLAHGRDFVKVKEEQLHVESYLKIQRFRYQDIMEYEIEMEAGILDYVIPKLLLQPVVENALYHGVKKKRGKSRIRVCGYQEGQKLVFKIIDNGKGMTEEELKVLQDNIMKAPNERQSDSFGLANINQRIKHYYGDENGYGLYVESKDDEGTTATIIIGTKKMNLYRKKSQKLKKSVIN